MLSLSLFFIASLAIASLKPSTATILRKSSSISMSIPVITPLFSSILAAKEVFLTISVKIFLLKRIFSSLSPLGFILGNSSAGSPMMLNSEPSHFIFTFPSLSSIVIVSSGSFLIISPKSFERTTTAPAWLFSTFIFFSMLRSRSEAAMVNIPFSSTFKSIPLRIGIVVLMVTAFETVLSALVSICCLHENFMIYLQLFNYLFFW